MTVDPNDLFNLLWVTLWVGGFIGGFVGYRVGRSDKEMAKMEREIDATMTRIEEKLGIER